jgi:hypothetical protein
MECNFPPRIRISKESGTHQLTTIPYTDAHMKISGIILVAFALSAGTWTTGRAERALWIEFTDKDGKSGVVAVTEELARKVLDNEEIKLNFSEHAKKELITRRMVSNILDGRQERITVSEDDGSEATLSMRQLKIPSSRHGNGKIVLETYYDGERSFRMAIPDIEIESAEEKGDEAVNIQFGWRALLPFFAETDGAIYIQNSDSNSEIWIYLD